MAHSHEHSDSHKRRRRYYLVDIPLEEATARFFGALEIIRGDAFRRDVEALGGYDVSRIGQAVVEVG